MPVKEIEDIVKMRKRLDAEYEAERKKLARRILKITVPLLALTLLAVQCQPARADDEEVLTTFTLSGAKTPIGGVGVYSQDYGKRIGTVERLGDGSTVMRGDYGKVLAKVEPRRSAEEPIRITTKSKK